MATGDDLVIDTAFMNVFNGKAYVHAVDYPISYSVNLREETWKPKPFMRSEHKLVQISTDDNYAELSNSSIVRLSYYDDTRVQYTHQYLDHLKFARITLGKRCQICLLPNGKLFGFGQSKARHFNSESHCVDVPSGAEIPLNIQKPSQDSAVLKE